MELKIGQSVEVVSSLYKDIKVKKGDQGYIRELKKQGKIEVANVDFLDKFGIIRVKHLSPIEKITDPSKLDVPVVVDEAQMDEFNQSYENSETEPEWLLKDYKPDVVNNPAHYTSGGIETIDYLKAKLTADQFDGFLLGNVIKYLSRLGKKDEVVQDAKKAQWYLNKFLEGK